MKGSVVKRKKSLLLRKVIFRDVVGMQLMGIRKDLSLSFDFRLILGGVGRDELPLAVREWSDLIAHCCVRELSPELGCHELFLLW